MNKQAEAEKQLGNDSFKIGNLMKAADHYTKAINFDPSNAIYYVNRAITYLKLGRNEDAQSDSTKALTIDKNNVKALWRRAVARGNLGQLEEAKQDLLAATNLEPKNKIIADELKQITEKIKSRRKVSDFINFPVKVLESSSFLPKEVTNILNSSEKMKTAPINPHAAAFNPNTPKSILEFERLWKETYNIPGNILKLLKTLPPNDLKSVFGSTFEEKHLIYIAAALDTHLKSEQDYVWTYTILAQISSLPRFSLSTAFLDRSAKNDLKSIFTALENNLMDYLEPSLENLRKAYLI